MLDSSYLPWKILPQNFLMDCLTPTSASHGWRGILAGRDLLKLNLGKVIGNGQDTKVWSNPWLSLNEPQTPIDPATEHDKDLLVKDLLLLDSKTWNVEKIVSVFPEHKDTIMTLKPSTTGAKDSYVWLGNNSGQYTARSGYHTAKNLISPPILSAAPEIPWNSLIWNTKISHKLKLFLWKAIKGALPVGELLASRGIINQSQCVRCGEPETFAHLFLHCRFAQHAWRLAPFKSTMKSLTIPDLISGLKPVQTVGVFASHRNYLDSSLPLDLLESLADSLASLMQLGRQRQRKQDLDGSSSHWTKRS